MKRRHHILNIVKNFLAIKFIYRPRVTNKKNLLKTWHAPSQPALSSIEPIITWIGQATFLIQIGGLNILTDPIFFSPSFFFPRIMPPGIALKNLPHIDLILISHNHADHMNKKSLLYLKKHNPTILVPQGIGSWFSKRGFTSIIEHRWGDKYTIVSQANKLITCTFLPAAHWSGTSLFNINKSLHGSWMINDTTQSIYFAGDSSYEKHFAEIGQQFQTITTTLLPIGPVEPRHLLSRAHLDGPQAIQAFLDLQATHFIPMHWGTFFLGAEAFETPITRLCKHWKQKQVLLKDKHLHIVKCGEAKNIS